VRKIDVGQRRARLGLRHHLATPVDTPARAAAGLVAVHATDPASVFLSLRARTTGVDPAAIEAALYEDRSLMRMLAMRRTMFVVPVELVPVLQAACANALAVAQQRRYNQLIAAGGVDDADILRRAEEQAARALAERGQATGAQLSAAAPLLRTQIRISEGTSYEATTNITTWVLIVLAAQGRIVRGRPMGSWISSQWRWSPVESWLPDGIDKMPAETARAELVRRWLRSFGPGTMADLRWWTGWTVAHVKQAVAAVGAVEVELDNGAGTGTGLVLPDDLEPVPEPAPWVALLPALDATPMGWSERSWYLGPHKESLFDRSGNVGPTVWCDGRIVGGWAQRASGEVVFRLLEDIGTAASRQVAASADAVEQWLGPARFTPRFRTPLERELVSP
jgi:hypothetical protein